MLTEAELRAYDRDGFLFPRTALTSDEAADCRDRFHNFAVQFGEEARGRGQMTKRPHLILQWVADLARHRSIIDAVEDIIGPDILCWFSAFFVKEGGSKRFVSWHQDGEYAVTSDRSVSAWVALTPATMENGCMRFLPGSHRSLLTHQESYHPDNILTRGQTIVGVDEGSGVEVVLAPGQFALFHGNMAHGSSPNTSPQDRIGLVFRYVAGDGYETQPGYESATLIRGADHAGKLELEPIPSTDFDPAAIATHARICGMTYSK
jgi:non-haem Fe2+, alpha-ketoglutarate-dependent halogenase